MKKITRREFFKRASVTAIGGYMAIKALPSHAGMIGMPMIHCHIPEHEDIGMMAVWHIMDTM